MVFSCPASRDRKACNPQDQVGRGLCLAPHEAAPPFATLKLTHVFRLARAEQHSPTLAITEPRLFSGQPHNREGGCWPTAAHKQLLATRPGRDCGFTSRSHSDLRTGVVLLIDRRTSRDHSSGLMRSGHSGPLGKSAVSAPVSPTKGARTPKKISQPASDRGAKDSHGQEGRYPGENLSLKPRPTSNFPRKNCQPYKLRAQYARGLPHFR